MSNEAASRGVGLNRNIRWLGFGTGIRVLGVSIIGPFISLYLRNTLHLAYTEIGLLLVLVNVLPYAASPVGGMIADRAGRRRIFLVSLGIEAAAMFSVALSMRYASLPGILIGGTIDSIAGSAFAGPAISAYTADFAKGPERTKAFTWLRIGNNAGFTVGVAFGGSLIGFIGFPGAGFLSAAIMGTGVILLFLLLSPSPYDVARLHRDSAQSSLPENLSGPKSMRNSLRILIHDRIFLLFCVAMMLAGLTEQQLGTTIPLYVNTVMGVTYGVLGIALALNGLIVIFGQGATTRLMSGRRHTTCAICGAVLYIAAFMGFGLLGLHEVDVMITVCALMVLLTFGENMNAIASMTLPSNLALGSELGAYNGAFAMIYGIGTSSAPVLGGLALGATTNTLVMWLLLIIPAIPALFLLSWLGSRLPKSANRV